MSDLISREEVKEILRTEWVKLFPVELDPYLSLAMEKIENIPSAEPKWIPVTERLPKDDTDVLCTIHFVGTHLGSLAREWLVDICHCRDGEWYTYLDDDAAKDAWFDVVAWMPLPELYKRSNERSE